MNTWKANLEETKQHYIDWWNHKGIVLNMWEHFQEGVQPHADVAPPKPYRDLDQRWFDPEWRAEYLDWYVAHSSLMADMLPVANTQLGPGSLAAILGGVFEGGEDTFGFTRTLTTATTLYLMNRTVTGCFTKICCAPVKRRPKATTTWACPT